MADVLTSKNPNWENREKNCPKTGKIYYYYYYYYCCCCYYYYYYYYALRNLMREAVRFFSPRYHILPKWAHVP